MRDRTGKFELVVRPKGRTPADEYPHRGQTWIEGRDNSSFVLDVTNHHHLRAMVVVSVDGVSVLSGQPASFDGQGYVIGPGQTLSIPGWAMSPTQAAEFFFTKKSEGYAEQTGQGGNAGVIGAAFFEERVVDLTMAHSRRITISAAHPSYSKGIISSNSASPLMSHNAMASSASVSSSMGTGFGESVDWNTVRVAFEKASAQPNATLVLNYDSAANLQRMGIRLRDRTNSASTNQAFPANNSGYCEPPPSWVSKNTR